MKGFLDAVKDGKLWLLVLSQHLHFAAAGYKVRACGQSEILPTRKHSEY